jgi:hypothetical protein
MPLPFRSAVIAGATGAPGMAGELTTTRVFGPEIPAGPYKHPAGMSKLKNGDF